jgi:uroporphyrinogen decarboxylase
MPKETMNGRERWEAVLTGEEPDRIPMDLWITEEAETQLLRHLGCDHAAMLEQLHIDKPLCVGPRLAGSQPEAGADIWGIRYRPVDYGTGVYNEVVFSPLAAYGEVNEIEVNYDWPSVDDFDFSDLPDQIKGHEHRPIQGGGSEPFLLYKSLRGEQQAFMDLLVHPEIVHYCLGKLFDFCYETTRRIFESIPGRVQVSYVAEDLGAQDALMFSPEQIHAFFLPGMKRMNDLVREHGSHTFFHSDGAIRDILPDIIAMGSEVLNPIQWPCSGMDREGLKRDFGAQLKFHGAVDNQRILPFGSKDDVREEVLTNIEILGRDGGYILAPCHNIQVVSPPENIVALYETGYDCGWMR